MTQGQSVRFIPFDSENSRAPVGHIHLPGKEDGEVFVFPVWGKGDGFRIGAGIRSIDGVEVIGGIALANVAKDGAALREIAKVAREGAAKAHGAGGGF